MILYTENPKDALRKLPELINEHGKLQVKKLTQRNLLHFYTLTRKDQKDFGLSSIQILSQAPTP